MLQEIRRIGLLMEQERVAEQLEVLRLELNKKAALLGLDHIEVLQLSKKLDELINLVQRGRVFSTEQ